MHKMTSDVTVVSAWYRVSSKHRLEDYQEWIKNFFRVGYNFVIFTNEESRVDLPEWATVIIKPESEFITSKWDDFWLWCETVDIERRPGPMIVVVNHSKEVYKVWNQKPFFLLEAAIKNPFNTKWFCWCDIGAFREEDLVQLTCGFPETIRNFPEDKMIVSMVNCLKFQSIDRKFKNGIIELCRNMNPSSSCHPFIRVQAGFFGGTLESVQRYASIYESELELWVREKVFAGKEQHVMYNLLLKYPEQFIVFPAFHLNLYHDSWFNFVPGFAMTPIFSAVIQGGLGNQMFQIAAAYSLALSHGGIVIFDRNSPKLIPGCTDRKGYWRSVFQKCLTTDNINPPWTIQYEHMDHSITPLHGSERYNLISGYFQSSKYFSRYKDQIKNLFTLRKKWGEDLIEEIISNDLPRPIIAVHVRLGDYRKYGMCLPIEYYHTALSKIPAGTTIVISDDPDTCQQLFPGCLIPRSGTDEEQLAFLTLTDYLVMSNSSFSWWGAYLGNHKQVFAPDPWFKNVAFCPEIWEPEWIKISV